jgi:hypothetical protein
MRDFMKAGHDLHIEGGVYITDQSNSNQPKSLVLYTNDELYAERQYRKQRLSHEKKYKIKRCAAFGLIVTVVLCSIGVWYYVQGNTLLASLLIGLGEVFVGLFALQYIVFEKNDVEQAHINKLREIDFILRERGAK